MMKELTSAFLQILALAGLLLIQASSATLSQQGSQLLKEESILGPIDISRLSELRFETVGAEEEDKCNAFGASLRLMLGDKAPASKAELFRLAMKVLGKMKEELHPDASQPVLTILELCLERLEDDYGEPLENVPVSSPNNATILYREHHQRSEPSTPFEQPEHLEHDLKGALENAIMNEPEEVLKHRGSNSQVDQFQHPVTGGRNPYAQNSFIGGLAPMRHKLMNQATGDRSRLAGGPTNYVHAPDTPGQAYESGNPYEKERLKTRYSSKYDAEQDNNEYPASSSAYNNYGYSGDPFEKVEARLLEERKNRKSLRRKLAETEDELYALQSERSRLHEMLKLGFKAGETYGRVLSSPHDIANELQAMINPGEDVFKRCLRYYMAFDLPGSPTAKSIKSIAKMPVSCQTLNEYNRHLCPDFYDRMRRIAATLLNTPSQARKIGEAMLHCLNNKSSQSQSAAGPSTLSGYNVLNRIHPPMPAVRQPCCHASTHSTSGLYQPYRRPGYNNDPSHAPGPSYLNRSGYPSYPAPGTNNGGGYNFRLEHLSRNSYPPLANSNLRIAKYISPHPSKPEKLHKYFYNEHR